MSEQNWNRRQTVKIANWLSKRKTDQSRLVVEWASSGTCEIRLYATAIDPKPQLNILVFGLFDLFVDSPHKAAHKRCWNRPMLYETIKEWYLNG